MFEQAKQKLKSQEGASLSMALMLMLVCTTVTGIVLAAATASAGRLSQMRETDRSYYNVTSAAKLLWDELGENGIRLEVTRSFDATLTPEFEWESVTKGDFAIPEVEPNNPGEDESEDIEADEPVATGAGVTTTPLTHVLVCDAMFPAKRVLELGNSEGLLSLAEKRDISSGDVTNSIDFSELEPKPTNLDYLDTAGLKYEFTMTPEKGTAGSSTQAAPPVKVTVKGEEGGYLVFSFEEADDPHSFCTLTAYISAQTTLSDVDLANPGNKHVVLDTEVTLTRDYLSTGGVQ